MGWEWENHVYLDIYLHHKQGIQLFSLCYDILEESAALVCEL